MRIWKAASRPRALLLGLVLGGGCVLAAPPAPAPPAASGPPQPLGVPLETEVAQVAAEPAGPTQEELVAALAPPELPREFRGVWVASVGNLDWPSRPGLPVEAQKQELLAMLDEAVALGLNAVIFQVRPSGDALYDSPHEPWSEYLTGRMGRAPEPYYDPLAFAVEEAHRRGLELHAWFNPFRAKHPSAESPASADHLSRARPDLVVRYGSHLWMDPGEPEVQNHSVRVILDVVRRYDVDGVHIDDYFYPYREYRRGRLIPFPDDGSYGRYRAAGGTLGRSDWRRENVNRFVERLYAEIKREKRRVKFGISPFGIWRPGYPAQVRGLDAYEEIFADARLWLNRGWLDYFTPQLYWPIAQAPQSFPVLLDWWVGENHAGRHIWPGSYTDRVGGSRGWPAREILDQIEVTRGHPGSTGHVHFRMSALERGADGLSQRLASETYARPALVPPSPWLDASAPARPAVAVVGRSLGATTLALEPQGEEEVFLWTVRSHLGGEEWATTVLPGWHREATVEGSPAHVVVTAVGRAGNEGPAAVVAPDDPGAAADGR